MTTQNARYVLSAPSVPYVVVPAAEAPPLMSVAPAGSVSVYKVIEPTLVPVTVFAVTWMSPLLLPVFVSVKVSVAVLFSGTFWLPPFVFVMTGAFCTIVVTVFEVAVIALPLESV